MVHKVFVSYHHDNDQWEANHLRDFYGSNDTLLDRSLSEAYEGLTNDQILAAIRTEHLKDSTVTIVLVGKDTAKRKWVDWEIYSSLRPYGDRSRNGLLAIMLDDNNEMPARLADNIRTGYAVQMKWCNISWQLKDKIEEAYANRNNPYLKVDNSRERRTNNGWWM